MVDIWFRLLDFVALIIRILPSYRMVNLGFTKANFFIKRIKAMMLPKLMVSNNPCVDDSLQVGEMLEKILIPHGMRLIKIQDAVQALPILIEQKPDLIFLDLIMLVANGYEICAQLRRVSAFANIPVIILTGSDGLIDRVRAKVVGSTDFINKPVTADKVLGVVRKHLQYPSSVKNPTTVGAKSTLHRGDLQSLPICS
jgi:DNA-binding response OmpR family regulator